MPKEIINVNGHNYELELQIGKEKYYKSIEPIVSLSGKYLLNSFFDDIAPPGAELKEIDFTHAGQRANACVFFTRISPGSENYYVRLVVR